MKKSILIMIPLVVFIALLTAFSNRNQLNKSTTKTVSNITIKQQDIREAVWNQMPSEDKELVQGTWQDSKVQKITLKKSMGTITDKTYIGEEVYLVDFKIKSIGIPNNIGFFASINNHKIIGFGYTD